mgnify:CR=1 FL=1
MAWANSGTVQFAEVQQATGATNAEMAALRKQIDNWDNGSGPDASERFAFVGESSAITQRTIETFVAPAFSRRLAPEFEFVSRDGKLLHRRDFHEF